MIIVIYEAWRSVVYMYSSYFKAKKILQPRVKSIEEKHTQTGVNRIGGNKKNTRNEEVVLFQVSYI